MICYRLQVERSKAFVQKGSKATLPKQSRTIILIVSTSTIFSSVWSSIVWLILSLQQEACRIFLAQEQGHPQFVGNVMCLCFARKLQCWRVLTQLLFSQVYGKECHPPPRYLLGINGQVQPRHRQQAPPLPQIPPYSRQAARCLLQTPLLRL